MNAAFIVVKDDHDNLWSLRTAVHLKIVILDKDVEAASARIFALQTLADDHKEDVEECSLEELKTRFQWQARLRQGRTSRAQSG